MKVQKTTAIVISAMVFSLAGCNKQPAVLTHKLVATGGEHAVPLYPDEATYVKVSHLSQQGGVNVYSRPLNEHLVTVLGEAPGSTVRQIAYSVGPR